MRAISALRGPFPDSRRIFSFASPLLCLPASTSLGEALVGGPVEGSSGRRDHTRMPDQLTVSTGVPLLRRFQNVKICVTICYSMAAKSTVWPRGETGPGGLAFGYMRNAEGLREPERKVSLTPVELALSRRRFKRSTYERAQRFFAGFHVTMSLVFILTYIYTSTAGQPLHCNYRYKVLHNIFSNTCGHTRSTARRGEAPPVCPIVIPDKPSLARLRFPDSSHTRKGGSPIVKTRSHDDIYLCRSAGRVSGRYNRCVFNGFGCVGK